MRSTATTLVTAAAALFFICSTVAAAQTVQSVVRGEVTDSSGGVLPGVTVVATAEDGRLVATVTDGKGSYVFRSLPAGPITLKFELAGFTSVVVRLDGKRGPDTRVVERLEVAPMSETVVVHGDAPVDPSSPFSPSPPPPVVIPVPAHDHDSVCGPAKPDASPESFGTIVSGRYDAKGLLYSTGTEVIIDGGLISGLDVGQNLVVRRYYRVRGLGSAGVDVTGEHSAGLLQIVTAGDRSSVAVVVYACDELMKGDFLASFKPESIRAPYPAGIPAFRDAARILFADEGQMLGAPRRMMVIDRGIERGVAVGQRFTLFRHGRNAETPDVVGDAVVVAVRYDSATIRVERVSDAVSSGDWAALQIPSSVSRQPPEVPDAEFRR